MHSLSYKVPENKASCRFDILAAKVFSQISRKKIKSIIDNGGAYVNKKRIKLAKYLVSRGDLIELFWEDRVSKEKTNSSLLIFTHDDFFVVNKPAGVPSQATLTSSKDTILHVLCQSDPEVFQLDELFLVHRLDKDTSGIMIIARNKKAKAIFDSLFKEHKIKKTYEAFTFYVPKQKEGKIAFPIYQDKSRKNTYIAATNPSRVPKDAKQSETNYRVLKTYKNEASFVQCEPKTGRTHQLRVHFSAIGCPFLGDKTYAQNIVGHRYAQLALRCLLHATKIAFHYEKEDFELLAPYPADFLEAQKFLDSSSL